ncbi:MAG: metallophosphoesterase [Silvanigrellaceae bacterium]|nr:metallophosphoesterase [Silvanigrellaceae bacterium]
MLQDNPLNLNIKSLEPSSERLPLFIVGDVHGCAQELSELITLAKNQIGAFQLILVGDLFTKGPDPVGVFELIQEHKALCIKGNHDWALWSTLLHTQKRNPNTFPEHTKQTLYLIRYHKRAMFDLLSSLPHAYQSQVIPKLKRGDWENSFPLIVVHAGIDCTRGLTGTSERMMLTARYVRWEHKGNNKKLVIVPSAYRAEMLNNNKIITENEKFRWHELHEGPELIVFGHDAKQGLFRKTLPSGRPICVGIDTGCTYGNSLTGYSPEFDLALQVRAHRRYFDIKKNIILTRPSLSKLAAV